MRRATYRLADHDFYRGRSESMPSMASGVSAPAPLDGSALPTGTVTFLFTDIEGSTQRWDAHREAMCPEQLREIRNLAIATDERGHLQGQIIRQRF